MARFDLRTEAERWADEVSRVLNNTLCKGIRLRPVIERSSGLAVVGYELQPDDLDSKAIPVTLGRKPPSCYLGLVVRLTVDETEGQHLMVKSSFMSVCLDDQLDQELLHYDYERDKADDYPEAHLQICAQADAWDALGQARGLGSRPLAKLHLPVGGRRNRPTLEDVIEFMIREGIADGAQKWREHVEGGRARFLRSQLRAAVRRDPETAMAELKRLKHI